MELTCGLYTNGKKVVVLSAVYAMGSGKLRCSVFTVAPFSRKEQNLNGDAFAAKYPHKIVGVQLPKTGRVAWKGALNFGMYTNGKVVVTLHNKWPADKTLLAYQDLPSEAASLPKMSEAVFRKRYPYKVDGVVFE